MTTSSFLFNGIRKKFIYCEEDGREHSAFAPVTRNLLTIPGLPGALLESTDTQVRVIRQRVFYKGIAEEDLRKLEEEMSAWILTEQPVPLIFDDEPDRIYYAVVDGSFDIEESLKVGGGTITFVCPDPYKYDVKENFMPLVNEGSSVVNNGTAETPPTFILNATKATPYIDIIGEDAYMRLGRIPNADDQVFEPRTLLFEDPMSTTVGWSKTTFGVDIGTITSDGEIVTDGESFLPQNYGASGSLLWHGPAVSKSLASEVSDYVFRFYTRHAVESAMEVGRSNFWLLDVNKKPIARLSLVKGTAGRISTPEIRLLGPNGETQYVLQKKREEVPKWDDVYSYLEIQKQGNTFTARAARTRGYRGRTEEDFRETFVDKQGLFTRPVAAVSVGFMKYANSPTLNRNRIQDTSAHRLNQQAGIPNIVQPGDVVEIDHKTNDIRINGETRLIKTFGSSFFDLKKGVNPLIIEPADAVTAEIRWRERFK